MLFNLNIDKCTGTILTRDKIGKPHNEYLCKAKSKGSVHHLKLYTEISWCMCDGNGVG